VAEVIAERAPQRIGVNRSSTFALADGLSATEYQALLEALPAEYHDRVVGAEALAIGWLETRTPEEMVVYPQIVRLAHTIIAEGFSNAVIQPGITTTDDVVWWYRQRIAELTLDTWFHPSVSLQRQTAEGREGDFSSRPDVEVIQPGDLLHVDFGITYLRLNTDTQQHAYVLRSGETLAPAGLVDALAVGNRLQDILTENFVAGRTGNEILAAALAQSESAGIDATIYTHPIGFHGHAAGPTIGMWDQQGGVPGRGDYPLFASTAFSIELNAAVAVPEWGGQEVRVMLEEDAFFDGERTWYIDGRQTELILINR
jgi:Xaa-Pro aminopeptidase